VGVLQTPGQDRPPTTRKRRLWTVAPGPPPSAQPYEGLEILNEIPTATGLALFEWLRAAHLWAKVDREKAVGLFWPAETKDVVTSMGWHTIEPPLDAIAASFAQLVATPERVGSDRLAAACTTVSEWATEAGNVATAAAFAEAAARLSPDDPGLCFRAGRANRHNTAYDRAVLWFQRGTGMARRSADWTAYIDCWIGWGNLEIARGRFNAAERLLIRAYRAAQKHNLPELGGAAQHDLFMLCVDQRRLSDAYVHASKALALYPPDHPFYPYLIHDLAQTWVVEGWATLALPILMAVRQLITSQPVLLQINGNVAGAAGMAGDMDTFYAAWDAVSAVAARSLPHVAGALSSVAEGAWALRLHRQAADVASTALRFAQQRQERAEEQRARSLLDKLRRAEPPPRLREPPHEVRTLADLLLTRLQERTEQT
jgi:tetratricopeptide (TPR) repeat protein